ncbi:hypothetical protein KBC04_05255 [Candidatus Babeliales bacterium]|nr:hypothetical protein [Candidatus Babeliales bacterium]MBP9844153.1 hypothetical protein [Candidatus Babeliales bacterium]
MRLEFIIGFQFLIIAFISYVITITFAGWFESLIALQVGDDAPEQAGFLTLNPLEHFNVFGFAALLWGVFYKDVLPISLIPGWGRYIPLIPDNINGSFYKLRVFIEYVGRSFAHLILLICAATCMMLLSGIHLHEMAPMAVTQMTSSRESIIGLLLFMCQQNLVLFAIHFILGIFKYIIYFHAPKIQEFSATTMILSFIGLLFLLVTFGEAVQDFAVWLVMGVRTLLVLLLK